MSGEKKQYSKVLLIILAIFLGGLGIHQFLAGNKKKAIMYIILSVGGYIFSMIMMFVLPFLSLVSMITGTVVFVFVVMDIIQIAKGQFMHVDGYSLVEGN